MEEPAIWRGEASDSVEVKTRPRTDAGLSVGGSLYGSTTFLSAFRFMMCGPTICRTLGQGSRSMSFRGRQAQGEPVQRFTGDARASKPPVLSRPTFWLGRRAAGKCVEELRDPFDSRRSLEVS